LIGLPAMLVLAVTAHFALDLFGPGYAALGTVPLWLRIAGYIPQMPRAQFVAVSRATNRVSRAAVLMCTFALCEAVSVYVGGKLGVRYIGGEHGGLYGLSFAYLGVLVVEGLITAPTVLRAAYVRTAAATGAFPAVSAAAGATEATAGASGPLRGITGELRKITNELARLTGPLPQPPGAPDREEGGLAALFAAASAAVVSDGNTLNVATEIWRTGGFPRLPPEATEPREMVPAATTAYDMYVGQAAPIGPARGQQATFQRRQQAGIDALLSIAIPVFPSGDTQATPVLPPEDSQAEDTQAETESPDSRGWFTPRRTGST
jgi:hypothetical protein